MSKCDELQEFKSLEETSTSSYYNQESSKDLMRVKMEKSAPVVFPASSILEALVRNTIGSNIVGTTGQQTNNSDDAQDRWRPSDESSLVSQDTHHQCLMAKKNKKNVTKKEQVKEIAQVDDQVESDVEIEDSYYRSRM